MGDAEGPVYHHAHAISRPCTGSRTKFQTPAPCFAPNTGTSWSAMWMLAGKTAIRRRMRPHAARALGINRSTLYYRMRKHGLEHLLPMKDAPTPSSSEGA